MFVRAGRSRRPDPWEDLDESNEFLRALTYLYVKSKLREAAITRGETWLVPTVKIEIN